MRAEPSIPNSPLGHWALDETGGTTASDYCEPPHSGELRGAAQWVPTDGLFGGALALDGTGGGIRIANAPVNGTVGGVTTVTAWLYWKGSPESEDVQVAFSVASTDSSRFYSLIFTPAAVGINTNLVITTGGTSGTVDIFGVSSAGFVGAWTHVVVSFPNGLHHHAG